MTASFVYRAFRILLLIANVIFFIITIGINAFGVIHGLFGNHSVSNGSDYDLDVVPDAWTFYTIWSIIYLFQAAIVVYSIANIFRSTPVGSLFYNPDIMPVTFVVSYMLNWVCNACWIVMAAVAIHDKSFLSIMTVGLLLLLLTLASALVFSYQALQKQKGSLTKFGFTGDIYAMIVVVQNGASIYATWSAIAMTLNGGMAFVYIGDLNEEMVSTIVLAVNAAILAIYACFDIFSLDRYTRFVFAPHCTYILALSGIVSRMGVSFYLNSMFALVLLVVAVILLIAKIIISIIRSLIDQRSILMKILEEENDSLELPLP